MTYHDLTETEASALHLTAAQAWPADDLARRLLISRELLAARLARLVSAGHLETDGARYTGTPAGRALIGALDAEIATLTENLRQMALS